MFVYYFKEGIYIYPIICGYIWSLKSGLIRHTVLDVSLRFVLFFSWFHQWKIRHYVFADLICWFGVHLLLEKWFKKTHFVSYFNKILLGLFHHLTSGQIRHYVLDHLPFWFGLHLVIGDWLKQTHYVRYFTNIHLICFMIWPVYKAENTR